MRKWLENPLINYLEDEAIRLFVEPRADDRVYELQTIYFRDLLIANNLTTIDQIEAWRIGSTSALVAFSEAGDPLSRSSLFQELSLAEKYVVLLGFLD